MSQSANQPPRDPRSRQRSPELTELLAHCPEHLFSTDDSQLAPIVCTDEAPEADKTSFSKAA